MVERVFDVHVLNKRYSLWEGTLVFKYVGKKRESRWWSHVFVDFFVIGRFHEKEVMDRSEGQHGIELSFQPRKECLALVTIKQHHVAHSQLGSGLIVKMVGKWLDGKYGGGTEGRKHPLATYMDRHIVPTRIKDECR